jgi:uncharacterized protein YndB with AHSA1/START domain
LATNERFMPVPPTAVWAALADAGAYSYWVVGSKEIRAADAGWPDPGTKIHHTIGVGPLRLQDHTEVIESRGPALLRLRAKGRPLGTAKITLELEPRHGGTAVSIHERPDGVTALPNLNPLVHVLTKARNAESLMRLEELARRHAT